MRAQIVELLDRVLPRPLPADWPADRPLTEAGLDSVALLGLVAEIESQCGLTLGDEELTEQHFSTLAGLDALLRARGVTP